VYGTAAGFVVVGFVELPPQAQRQIDTATVATAKMFRISSSAIPYDGGNLYRLVITEW
jgi:hypothetical protein